MRREGIQLCYPFEESRLYKWEPPVIVQPKLDGVRCRAIPSELGWTMVSSENKVIDSVPHILNELNYIPRHYHMELDGELYNHELPFESITSITSRSTNLHENFTQVQFHAFDIVSEQLPQHQRLPILKSLFRSQVFNYLKMVDCRIAFSIDEIMELHEEYMAAGYEGIVVREKNGHYVRKRSTSVMKFKPTKADWYKITGYKEEIDKHGNPKGRVGALLCEGDDGTPFSVGSGLSDQMRVFLWENPQALEENYVKVQYQHLTKGKGAPRFPVFVEIDTKSRE